MVLCFALIIATSDPLCRVHFSESRNTVCGECLYDAVWMNQIFFNLCSA